MKKLARAGWFLLVLAACSSSEPAQTAGGDGGSMESETTAAGGSDGGSGGEHGASTSDGGAGWTANPLCAKYQDPSPQRPVTITFVNQRAASIYLDTACRTPFSIVVDGAEHEAEPNTAPGHVGLDGAGVQTCGSLEARSAYCCDCSPNGVEIPAGGTFDVVWHGLLYDGARMPAACWANASDADGYDEKCFLPADAKPGLVTARARAFGSFTPGPVNLMTDPIAAEQAFVYGTDDTVRIVVE